MLMTGLAQTTAANAYIRAQTRRNILQTFQTKTRLNILDFTRRFTEHPESGLSVILLRLEVTFSSMIELIGLTVGQRAIRRPLTLKED